MVGAPGGLGAGGDLAQRQAEGPGGTDGVVVLGRRRIDIVDLAALRKIGFKASGIGKPVPIVITRMLPSTVQSTMPGNHVCSPAASRTRAHTSSALRRMRISWR